ncbi:hypothetical protein [Streptomyces niveus]|uniref:hypothetical protein n=1 Tax=Streptomyces niveus TaxID=193462 RepID=UPI00339F8D60
MAAARALAVGLVLTGFGNLALAALYAHAHVWPLALWLATGAWICPVAAGYLHRAAARRRADAVDAEQRARRLAIEDALVMDDCCETWWTSAGGQHEPTCPNHARSN